MKIIVFGAGGRMGTIVCDLIEHSTVHEIAAKVTPDFQTDESQKKYSSLDHFQGEADSIIDFSHHTAVKELCDYAMQRRLPLVIATTGHTAEEQSVIENAAHKIPIFKSGNMSLGIALLAKLAKLAAQAFPEADIEIIEKHHNRKLDVPSGTALLLADGIKEVRPQSVFHIGRSENGRRDTREIGIHSVRMGNEVGTHEIILATDSQVITLSHQAENRSLFAEGALRACEFVSGQPAGLYNMDDLNR